MAKGFWTVECWYHPREEFGYDLSKERKNNKRKDDWLSSLWEWCILMKWQRLYFSRNLLLPMLSSLVCWLKGMGGAKSLSCQSEVWLRDRKREIWLLCQRAFLFQPFATLLHLVSPPSSQGKVKGPIYHWKTADTIVEESNGRISISALTSLVWSFLKVSHYSSLGLLTTFTDLSSGIYNNYKYHG